jgi:NADPH-dependent ferric siderophore reductase
MAPKMRITEVSSVIDLSPHMKRIILTGDELVDFPQDKKGSYVKAIFPNPKSNNHVPKLGMYPGFRKWMRSYTIREFNTKKLELTLDFAVNDHQGLATNWAMNAKPGDKLGIAGPGDIKHNADLGNKRLFIGDFTALPAIAALLEQLSDDEQGNVWLQVPDQKDIQNLKKPVGIIINWIVTPNKLTNKLLDGLVSESNDLSDTAIFIAAEMGIIKQLKQHINQNCIYDKQKLYATAYWDSAK